MKMTKRTVFFLVASAACLICLVPAAQAPQMSKFERSRMLEMLNDVASDVQKHYYDPTFHGVDWEAKTLQAKQKIENESSLSLSLAHIAATLDTLNDSHTFFLPPPRPYRHDYGFQTEMIGDQCFVTRVRPGSDAEAKGVKPGDQVLAIEGWRPTRENLWKMDFRFRVLRPQAGLRLMLRNLNGPERYVDVAAKLVTLERVKGGMGDIVSWDGLLEREEESHRMRPHIVEVGDNLVVLKFPQFLFDKREVDRWIDKARGRQSLIVDLRDNSGGAIDTLKYLLGGIFQNEVKIADRVGRNDSKPELAKPRGGSAFTGRVIVLVDSKSASASELFARVVQLEKRGTVVGDRSSGSVMEAKHYAYHMGTDMMVFYGASITESDLVMSDGKSLEHIGVSPDEVGLPTAADLAAGRDPVLSRAAAMLGVKLTPEEAGKMFPYEWPAE